MGASDIFAVGSQLVLPGWLLLVLAPRWRWTHRIVFVLAAAYGVAYIALFGSQVAGSRAGSAVWARWRDSSRTTVF